MKYIIEIEDEPLVRKSALHGEDAVYRAKGFKSLVFDKSGLEKLKQYDPFIDRQSEIKYEQEKAYKKGLADAWSLAQKIDTYNGDKWEECFGTLYTYGVLSKLSYEEAREKVRSFENCQEKHNAEMKMLDQFCKNVGYTIEEISEIIKRFQK